jgi:lysophospholipase L1-like esterase
MKNRLSFLLSNILILVILFSCEDPQSKVFVVGDSISMHYGPYLEESLDWFMEYDRKGKKEKDLDNPSGANGGDSQMVLSYLNELKANMNFEADYLVVNCGLHDIKKNTKSKNNKIPLKQYSNNLEQIILASKELGANLVWINSTPVVDSIHNSKVGFLRYNDDVVKYNNRADSIMTKNNIPIIDLYSFTQSYIPAGYMDHVHYKEEIRQKQAAFIADHLAEIIEKR